MKRIFTFFLLLFSISAHAQFAAQSLDFDGTNDMVTCSSMPALFSNLATNNFTIEAWVNPRGSAFTRIIFAQSSTSNYAAISTNTGNTIYFYVVAGGTTYSIATNASIPQNQWTHIAATWSAATQTTAIYFNGVQQSTTAGGSSSTGTNGLLVLGSRPGGAQYFNGGLDDVRIWSEPRSACQILTNMNNSITGVQSTLVLNYNFNQGVAGSNNTGVTTLPDVSGNSFNGTLTNFALSGSTSNWISSGAVLSAQGNPLNGFSSTENETVCYGDDYTFPDGTIQYDITSASSHVSHLLSQQNCDSTVTTNLTVTTVNTAVSLSGTTLSAAESAATYQWLDCNNGNSIIADETLQSYTPAINGSYAVNITKNGCLVTSACTPVVVTSTLSRTTNYFSVYPNPTANSIILSSEVIGDGIIEVRNIAGNLVLQQELKSFEAQVDLSALPDGVYWISITSSQGKAVEKISKVSK